MAGRKAGGVTLPEMVVVVGILAVSALLALPGWGQLIARARVRAALDTSASLFRHARAVAMMRRQPVAVCPVLGDRHREIHGCRRDGRERRWRDGILVFVPDAGAEPDAYRTGQSLRYGFFDRNLVVRGPEAFMIGADGDVAGPPPTLRIADVSGHACGTVTLVSAGGVARCFGSACPGCSE
ncbi:pilus assembly FimT family protein [Paludibacterium paludis]|uniref:Type II secretion system protein H n=1 Tax=Paludibacterium paludis TaxID=1225769 RepID=A0A918P3C7_9NEIS|nr:GspH/FimT family pseudopilin [Paludibacterium paludis]GGY16785.1 hypothetical protein GCM10011289_20250 [Paludibacterium paludis]